MRLDWKKKYLFIHAFLTLSYPSAMESAKNDPLKPPYSSLYRFDDPRLLDIEIKESQEPMVYAQEYKIPAISDWECSTLGINRTDQSLTMRRSVAEKLVEAQSLIDKKAQELKLPPLQLCLLEGYAPLINIHNEFERKLEADDNFPHDKEKAWNNTAWNYAPLTTLDGIKLIPPRATGGMVSVGVWKNQWGHRNIAAMAYDFGFSITNKDTWQTDYIHPDPQVHAMRQTFVEIMTSVGLVNTGKIHRWVYGNSYAALIKGEKTAFYGVVENF